MTTTCEEVSELNRALTSPSRFLPTPSPPEETRQVKRSSSPRRARASALGGAFRKAWRTGKPKPTSTILLAGPPKRIRVRRPCSEGRTVRSPRGSAQEDQRANG